MEEIQVNKLDQSNTSISLDSDIMDSNFINYVSGRKSPAKECFKVIHGLGKSADRKRLLFSETKEERKMREQLEKEEAEREAFKSQVFQEDEETRSRSSASSKKA